MIWAVSDSLWPVWGPQPWTHRFGLAQVPTRGLKSLKTRYVCHPVLMEWAQHFPSSPKWAFSLSDTHNVRVSTSPKRGVHSVAMIRAFLDRLWSVGGPQPWTHRYGLAQVPTRGLKSLKTRYVCHPLLTEWAHWHFPSSPKWAFSLSDTHNARVPTS